MVSNHQPYANAEVNPMTAVAQDNALLPTEDLILALFCRVDDRLEEQMLNRKHS